MGRATDQSICVLVVENHDEVRALIANVVVEQGWQALQAVGISEALRYLKEHHIDAIISDWELNDGDGRSLLEAAGRTGGHRIPVVVVSSYASPELREEAIKAGAIDLLEKPFRIEQLTGLLNSGLQQAAALV
ncbi:MAG TPA: response regulator [Acidobacteriota bacterium]|nr:response regulator [Acidobacteriota bacterium]